MVRTTFIALLQIILFASCQSSSGSDSSIIPKPTKDTFPPPPEFPFDNTTLPYYGKVSYSDTLIFKTYNPVLEAVDLRAQLLPGFLEECKVEIIARSKPEPEEFWVEGLDSIINFGFSLKEVGYVDDAGGKWYNTFDLFQYRFASAEQAVFEFNRQLKGIPAYLKLPMEGQGFESRRVLIEDMIFMIEGTCRTGWWVRELTNRIIWLYRGSDGIAEKTMIRTFCGGGICHSPSIVIAPEPIKLED